MHTKFAIGAIIAKQGFEHLGPPRPANCGAGRMGEGFGDGAVLILDHTRIPEHAPGQGDGICLWQGRQQIMDAAVSDMDVYELVNITKEQPIGRARQRVFVGRLEHRPLRAFGMGAVIAHMGQPAHFGQAVKQRISPIRAIVREDQKICKATGAVMGKPFQQKCAFVLDSENCQNAHVGYFTVCLGH